MITVGGNNTNGLTCDWEVKGVAVWELTTLTWGSVFSTNLSSFQVPEKVLGVTGGSANGNATKKDPALGWTDQGLKDVFATPRKYTLTGNNTTAPASPSTSHTGAIAGGVVGGVLGLALIATAAFFLRRRHQRLHGPHELHDNPSPARNASDSSKNKYELQALNENNPAELFGADPRELEAPRDAVEAENVSSTMRAELPGTSTAPGAVHGVPIVRTPGDELPERPEYVGGLRRPSQEDGEANSGTRPEQVQDQVTTRDVRANGAKGENGESARQ